VSNEASPTVIASLFKYPSCMQFGFALAFRRLWVLCRPLIVGFGSLQLSYFACGRVACGIAQHMLCHVF